MMPAQSCTLKTMIKDSKTLQIEQVYDNEES